MPLKLTHPGVPTWACIFLACLENRQTNYVPVVGVAVKPRDRNPSFQYGLLNHFPGTTKGAIAGATTLIRSQPDQVTANQFKIGHGVTDLQMSCSGLIICTLRVASAMGKRLIAGIRSLWGNSLLSGSMKSHRPSSLLANHQKHVINHLETKNTLKNAIG